MKTIKTVEKDVNQIRLQIYEKTKDMTPSQLTGYYLKSGEATAKKYGFKIIASAKEKNNNASTSDLEQGGTPPQ